MTIDTSRPHAELMRIWEEGYVANPISYEYMHARLLFVLDGGPLRGPDGHLDRAKILRYIEAKVASLPEFRVRLMRSFLGLTPPAWVPDEQFDLQRHVRFADQTRSLTHTQLSLLAGWSDDVMPIDHPLWRILVTELDDGDVVLGFTLHHSTADGFSAMKLLTRLTDKAADAEPKTPDDPFASRRAPRRGGELPWLALRTWLAEQPSPAAAWRSYWRMPVHRRVRRLGGRWLRPVRSLLLRRPGVRQARLPPRHSDFRVLDSRRVVKRAAELDGTMGDLLNAAAIVASAHGGRDPHVRLRLPVAQYPGSERARNHVRDMEVYGSATDGLADLMRSIRSQTESRETVVPEGAQATSRQIGYTTLVVWRSTPRYFCGARVKDVVPFAAGLPDDELSAGAILYDGRLTVTATMQSDSDVAGVIEHMRRQMLGDE